MEWFCNILKILLAIPLLLLPHLQAGGDHHLLPGLPGGGGGGGGGGEGGGVQED